ncbi:chymotrypsin-2-like isoform X2 [Leptopilina heterotoma]|uniref:chymotrypsin-2-like isoform X2 n=1 Tax=Leptopilina heterotoma TaxID=63436 RepID=UPI001CA86F99|nr:chymotrypsin-2-like isoform X2 [Leptopilina heterotoma]
MELIFSILVTFLSSQLFVTAEDMDPKIVGGSLAKEGQFPYQVSLRKNNKHFCGGSIINENWILTAAHCLTGFNDSNIDVVAGTNTLDEGGVFYKSKKIIPHPNYSSILIRNDLGLIQLEKAIEFTDKIKSITLPTDDFSKFGNSAVLSGWGTTSYPGKPPNELQHIFLTVIPQKECLSANFRITNNNICTLNKKGEGACHGDSGGPLVADDVQIGIVSWGKPCAKGQPDVFTRVYSYMNWINKHIKPDESTNSVDD